MNAKTALRLPPRHILEKWNTNRIQRWLSKNGFEDFVEAFQAKDLDGKGLVDMGEDKIIALFSEVKISRRRQLAKCVTECKNQAAHAKQLVGNIKTKDKKNKYSPNAASGTTDDDDDDDDDWGWGTDFDESEGEISTHEEIPGIMPNGSINGVSNEGSTHEGSSSGESKEECSSVCSIGSEASSYASGSSGSVPPNTVKRVIPKPPEGLPRPDGRGFMQHGIRAPYKRPPSQPPPPPKLSESSSSLSDPSQDYEIPISQASSSRTTSPSMSPTFPPTRPPEKPDEFLDIGDTYEKVEDGNGENENEMYEVVGEPGWQSSSPLPPPKGVDQPVLPPRSQGHPIITPPPPLPAKPVSIREKSSPPPGYADQFFPKHIATVTEAYLNDPVNKSRNYEDTVIQTISPLVNRPLPPLPNAQIEEDPMSKVNLETHDWFHDIEREEAENLLKRHNQDGTYLVRVSKRGGDLNPFTLSILYEDRIFHLNIRFRPDRSFALGSEKPKEKTFHTVSELIRFHQKESIILTTRGRQAGKTTLKVTPEKLL